MTIRRVRVKRKPIRLSWKIKCTCGRRLTLHQGQTRKCICGNVYKG